MAKSSCPTEAPPWHPASRFPAPSRVPGIEQIAAGYFAGTDLGSEADWRDEREARQTHRPASGQFAAVPA